MDFDQGEINIPKHWNDESYNFEPYYQMDGRMEPMWKEADELKRARAEFRAIAIELISEERQNRDDDKPEWVG